VSHVNPILSSKSSGRFTTIAMLDEIPMRMYSPKTPSMLILHKFWVSKCCHFWVTRATSLLFLSKAGEKGQISYRNTLIENVKSQAINAIRRTEAKAFCRLHILSFEEQEWLVALCFVDSIAKLRFAESNTMKNRSRNIRRILAIADRRPRGFPVYSS